jgi:hypothetical protein
MSRFDDRRGRRPDHRHDRRDDRRSDRPGDRRNDARGNSPGGPSPAPDAAPRVRPGDPTPFELFCAYYLGIAKDGSYRPANIHTLARQFNRQSGELKQLLQNYGIDPMAVMERDFDLAMAQIDIQLAPEGVNRVELARPLFEEFLAAPRKKIDWQKILEEDRRENAKIFGRRGD